MKNIRHRLNGSYLLSAFLLCSSFLAGLASAEVEIPRFLEISTGLYRSGRPNKDALEWLKEEHKIKTIINLENDDYRVERERGWAEELGLNFYSVPMSASQYPSDRTVNEALDLMNNVDLHPLLIHCKHGRDRTGMIVGLYRVESEGMSAEDAYEEMLDLGFRQWLFNLDNYFKDRTGLDQLFMIPN